LGPFDIFFLSIAVHKAGASPVSATVDANVTEDDDAPMTSVDHVVTGVTLFVTVLTILLSAERKETIEKMKEFEMMWQT